MIKNTARGNTKLAVFAETENGFSVRVQEIDGEPWFVAKDVCDALDIANSRDAVAQLSEDEKGVVSADTLRSNVGATDGKNPNVGLTDTKIPNRGMQVVNEPGLYRLIFQSRKSTAEVFKRWVLHEVLPAIRKTGSYSTRQENPDVWPELQKVDDLLARGANVNTAIRLVIEGLRKNSRSSNSRQQTAQNPEQPGATTNYARHFYDELLAIVKKQAPVHTAQLAREAFASTGMSRRTFYRVYSEMRDLGVITARHGLVTLNN